MQKQYLNTLVLSCTQATLQTTGVTMIAVTGLTGFALAENKALATLPLTCYVLGSAMTTIPASFLMKRVGAIKLSSDFGSRSQTRKYW